MDFQKAISYLLVSLDLPFRIVDKPEFQRPFRMLKRDVQLPGRTKAKGIVMGEVEELQQHMFDDLCKCGKLSLAIDCWTSTQQLAFLAIIASYITPDWVLRQVLVAFEEVPEKHTGVNLAQRINDVISQHKLHGRIIALTADNASNNKTIGEALDVLLSTAAKDLGSPFYGVIRIHCMSHVIQLSAKAFFKYLDIKCKDEKQSTDFEKERRTLASLSQNTPGTTCRKVCVNGIR